MLMASKKTFLQRQRPEIVRFIQYMISGGAYFWSGYFVFFIADQLLGLNLWWAKLAANLTGWTVNYLLQRYWVFNSAKLKGKQTQVTGRYVAITALNFVLDYLIVRGLKSLGLTPYIGQFVSAGFFTIWNYLWYKLWVFKGTSRKG
jgi:putative flippase GtrA